MAVTQWAYTQYRKQHCANNLITVFKGPKAAAVWDRFT